MVKINNELVLTLYVHVNIIRTCILANTSVRRDLTLIINFATHSARTTECINKCYI